MLTLQYICAAEAATLWLHRHVLSFTLKQALHSNCKVSGGISAVYEKSSLSLIQSVYLKQTLPSYIQLSVTHPESLLCHTAIRFIA